MRCVRTKLKQSIDTIVDILFLINAANLFIFFAVSFEPKHQISHLLEQPFRLMPLLQLSKLSMTDVGDALIRRPVPLEQSLLYSSTGKATTKSSSQQGNKPEYW